MRALPARPVLALALAVAVGAATLTVGGAAEATGEQSPAQAARVGHADPTVHRDSTGREYVVEPRLPGEVPAATLRRLRDPDAERRGAGRAADVTTLHSDPGAPRTIYLDVDGVDVGGTMWNDEEGLTAGVVGPFDPAGNGKALTAGEADLVHAIWARVAEDFAPWRVDVTTEVPGRADIERTSPQDQAFGMIVVITSDPRPYQQLCDSQCGGIAYLDVFDLVDRSRRYQPAFVLTAGMGDKAADANSIATATSHEVGHTLRLHHDLRSADVDGYYAGHDPWAPIMGSSYTQPLNQWSNGAFAGSLNTEDDTSLLTAGGLPRRPDEAGNSLPTATEYTVSLPATSIEAVIGTREDVDVYRLRGCAGDVAVSALTVVDGPNLDVRARLIDAAGATLVDRDPLVVKQSETAAGGLSAAFTTTVPAPGTYYVAVEGVGKRDSTPTNGYDDYGSLGRYQLTVTGCGADGAPGAVRSLAARGVRGGTTLTWQPSTDGPLPTSYDVTVGSLTRTVPGDPTGRRTSFSTTVTGLTAGRTYDVSVVARTETGPSAAVAGRAKVPAPIGRPSAPRSLMVTSGRPGGKVSVSLRWKQPKVGGPVKVYRVWTYHLDRRGRVARTTKTKPFTSTALAGELVGLARGRYRFAVQGRTSAGWGALSKRSKVKLAR